MADDPNHGQPPTPTPTGAMAIIALIASLLSLATTLFGLSKTDAEITKLNGESTKVSGDITQLADQHIRFLTSIVETDTARVVDQSQATSTQQVVYTAAAATQTTNAEQLDFTPKYFCSRTAYVDTTDDNAGQIRQWAQYLDLTSVRPIKTSYWSRVASLTDREYLFIAFLNRGAWVKIADFLNPVWELRQNAPDGWDEANEVTGQEKMEEKWAYVLLVADRPAQSSGAGVPGAGMPTVSADNPSLPSGSTPFPNAGGSPLQSTGLFFDCGDLASWGIQQVSFTLALDPDGLSPSQLPVELKEGGSVAKLNIPPQ